MKKPVKWVLIVLFGLAAVSVPLGIYAYRSVIAMIQDCYAQWAIAEIIISYAEENDELPTEWSSLPRYRQQGMHHGGLSFEEIRERIIIDFDRLEELAEFIPFDAEIPEIIQTTSGRESHWEGAEPNHLVNDHLARLW